MDRIIEYLEQPNPKYTAKVKQSSFDNSEYNFDLNFNNSTYSDILSEVKVKASTKNTIQFILYPGNPELSTIQTNYFVEKLNIVNTKARLGCLKYSKREGLAPIFLSYMIAPNTYDISSIKSIFFTLLDALIDQLYLSISEFLKIIREDFDDFDDSDNSDHICSYCGEEWTCDCDLDLGMEEEEIKVLEEININSVQIKKIFDFDEQFYCQESNIYLYAPQNTLENRLMETPLSDEFWISFNELMSNMKQANLICQKFPSKLLIVNIKDKKIVSVKIAPAFKKLKIYKAWFNSKTNNDFESNMTKEVLNLILASTKVGNVKPDNFLSIESLDISNYESKAQELGEGGFARVFRNSIRNKEVVLKIPHLRKESLAQSRIKIINEFSVSLLIDGNNTLKPLGIIEFKDSKYGIVFDYCNGESLKKRAASMSPYEIKETMKSVAYGIYHIHSKGFIHQDIKPSNIIFHNSKPIIIDFGFAVKESQKYLTRGFTLEYADPDQLEDSSPGKPADIWSFALTYISVVLNDRPYGNNVDWSQLAKVNNEDKRAAEKRKRRFFIDQIKIEKKRPPFHLIKEKVSPSVFEILKACLNEDPLSRPTIDQVLEVLNINN